MMGKLSWGIETIIRKHSRFEQYFERVFCLESCCKTIEHDDNVRVRPAVMTSKPILVPRTIFVSSFFSSKLCTYKLCICVTAFYRWHSFTVFYLIWQILFGNIYHDMGPQQGIFGTPPPFVSFNLVYYKDFNPLFVILC